jgi:hypothetical protein
MSKLSKIGFVFVLAFVLSIAALLSDNTAKASSTVVYGTTDRGIVPTAYPGNFVSTDSDQVCYDLELLGYIGDVTTEMRGVRVDIPGILSDPHTDFFNVTFTNGGRTLNWTTTAGTTILAFVIKGGPNFHVYDYVANTGTPQFMWSLPEWDNGLVSPLHRRNTPAVSHFDVCYMPEFDPAVNGCTPGYWRNHADRWAGVLPTDDFDTTFGVDLFSPDISLGQAIQLGGGGINALARHATAALLNAHGGIPNANGSTVAYPFNIGQIIQMVQDAVANGTIEATKELLDAANNLGCPLTGTRANPV